MPDIETFSKRNLCRSQGVEAGNRDRVVSRHQHKGLADAPAHGLVDVLLEKAIEGVDAVAEGLAIVTFGIESLLLKNG